MKYKSSTNKPIAGLGQPLVAEMKEETLSEQPINKGMFSDIDPGVIPEGGLSLAQNAVVRDDKTSRRPGLALFTPVAPNTNRVLRITDFVRGNGVTNLLRHTKDSIHYANTSAWTAITGPALIGTDFDQIKTAVIDDRYFMTNNGKNVVMEVNVDTNTYAVLGNCDKYKRITGFANRVIVANLQGATPDPLRIGWSGDLNLGEFDPIVDPSAGFISLVDSSEDASDFVTDIFGFDAVLIILRQKSIWVATKQPSASDPFNFFARIPSQGCTCPNGAARYPEGIVFPDLRSKSVYTLDTDGKLSDIGAPIRRALMAAISDPDAVMGSYDPIEAEYSIIIPNEQTSVTKQWTFNFRTKAWSYAEFASVCCISDVNNIAGSRTIDELIGTIDSLSVTINGLSAPVAQLPRRVYGTFVGDIAIQTSGQTTDLTYYTGYGYHYGEDYGGTSSITPPNFNTKYRSKSYRNPGKNLYISQCNYEVTCRTPGTFTLEYSRDDGKTFIPFRIWTISSNQLVEPIILSAKRLVNTRRFMWQLSTTNIDNDLLTEVIKVYPNTGMELSR